MPSPTFIALAKTVLTGTQATITFSSIPGTYTDLMLLISAKNDRSNATVSVARLYFNGDNSGSPTTYSYMMLRNEGNTGATSGQATSTSSLGNLYLTTATSTGDIFTNIAIYVGNYAASVNKQIFACTNAEQNISTGIYQTETAALWRNTNPITQIDIDAGGFNFISGSRFDLYGIKNS